MSDKKCNCNEPYDSEAHEGGYPRCPVHDKPIELPSESAGVKDISYDAELQFKDIPEPIGSFILAQNDIEYTQTANGAYWHYSAVCALLGRYAQESAGASAVWVKATERLPDKGGIDNKVIVRGVLNEQGYANHFFVAYGFRNFSKEKQEMYFEYGSKSFLTNDLEWLDESPAAQVKEDAVAFAEWLWQNRWFLFENGNWYYTFEMGTAMSEKSYQKNYVKTTAQLYDIYKNQNK